MNTESLIPQLRNLFPICLPLDGDQDAIRCERRYKDQTRAVYFFRASSMLPDSDAIRKINEEILSSSYFRSSDASRWNHYFVIVTDDEIARVETFYKAKQALENDKSYARKFVITRSELSAFVGNVFDEPADHEPSRSILDEWLSRLNSVGLGAVSTDRQRLPAIRDLRSGAAHKEMQSTTELAQIARLSVREPAPQMLTSLAVKRFGVRRLSGTYPLKRVNLIVGPNGAGKTSLLECIEHFFCGATYRSGGKSEDLNAIAFFEQGVAHPYSPLGSNEAQARDQHWYGNTVLRGNKLCQGFSRFNFLNTDAAVDFSRDDELQNLTDSLSKIALGPETTYTWSRIVAFEKDISTQLSTLESELATLNGSIEHAVSRLAALQTASPQIEAIALQVRDSLSTLAWPDPEVPGAPDSEWFARFVSLLGLVNASDAISPIVSMDRLSVAIDDLHQGLKDISLLEADGRSESIVARDVGDRRSRLASLRKLSERQAEYSKVRFIEAVGEERRLRASQAALAGSLFGVDALAEVEEVARTLRYSQRSIDDLVVAVKYELAEVRDQVDAAESRRVYLDRQLVTSESLIAEIRALGRTYAEASPEAHHCPLCRTQMEMTELISRLDDELGRDARSAELELLKNSKSALEKRVRRLSDCLVTATAMCDAFGDRAPSTVEGLIGLLRQANEELQGMAAQVEQARWRVSMLEDVGFSTSEYTSIVSAIDDWLSDSPGSDQSEVSRAELFSSRLNAAELELDDQARALKNRADERTLRESAILDRYGLPNIQLVRDQLQRQLAHLKDFRDRFESLPVATRSRYVNDVSGLIAASKDATARIDELSLQIQRERARSAETSVLHQQIAIAGQQVATKNDERLRLADALNVLHDIQGNLSLDSGLSAFVRNNLESIQRIFARIHVPHELRISDLSGCRLERIDSNRVTELNQISTGQRAALVLSIFISLNISLKSGPPYMLIDDPIAHVDDLNVLSFLDLLADIAETGHRQIFFATANEKLAHLFQKKMEFLGADFQTIDMTGSFGGDLVVDQGATQH